LSKHSTVVVPAYRRPAASNGNIVAVWRRRGLARGALLAGIFVTGVFLAYLLYANWPALAARAEHPSTDSNAATTPAVTRQSAGALLPGTPAATSISWPTYSATRAPSATPTPTRRPPKPAPTVLTPGRINVLVLGADARANEGENTRTDSMIVLSLDPSTRSAAMLSIPRDLWVFMPPDLKQVDEERINTAYEWGVVYNYPGGGPALAKRTVEYNIGITAQYYVRINFDGFQRIIDELGGIDVNVPREILDTAYPTADYGVTTVHFLPGMQTMTGELALQYARTRHDSSDIDRAQRQQQVILAVLDRALKLDFPITRIPALLGALGNTVQTDMPLDKMVQVAQVLRQMRSGNVRQAVIDQNATTEWTTPGGAWVLLPQPEKIQELVLGLFSANVTADVKTGQ
jgi:polyisoprenyl-teichoic acid--peptidoglycan teichoic acid transferase